LSLHFDKLHLDLTGLTLHDPIRRVDRQILLVLVHHELTAVEAFVEGRRTTTPVLLHLEWILLCELFVVLIAWIALRESGASVATHFTQVELAWLVINLVLVFFEAEHTVLIFAPAEDFALARHSEALLIASENLGDFMRTDVFADNSRARYDRSLASARSRLFDLLVPTVSKLAELVVTPGVDIALSVKSEGMAATCGDLRN